MSTHYSKTFDAPAKRKRKVRAVALGIVSGVLAVAGGAYAAIALTSNETEAALAKGNAETLVLDQAQFTKPLFPGTSTGLKFRVINNNAFPATIDKIVLNGTSTTTCPLDQLTGPAANVGTVNGLTLTLASPVTVPANNNVVFEYPKVVTLKATATDSCTINAKFKVTGVGAGSEG